MCLQVLGVATEDMDALTFGTPRLIRNLMAPASAKITVTEYDYDKVSATPATIEKVLLTS